MHSLRKIYLSYLSCLADVEMACNIHTAVLQTLTRSSPGRHVYATLIDLHDTYKQLSNAKRDTLGIHITMLDHHPAILARDLCILMLLDQLTDDHLEVSERLEVEATLVYTYCGMLLPSYCDKRSVNSVAVYMHHIDILKTESSHGEARLLLGRDICVSCLDIRTNERQYRPEHSRRAVYVA